MTVTTGTTFNWSPALLVDSVARGFKSIMQGSGPEDRKITQTWVEISPYGFVSSNYFRFMAGNLSGCRFCVLEDGSRVINFEDGTTMFESASGHLIELDRRRRVVLVRVTRAEAEGAKLSFGKSACRNDLSDCYKVTSDESGNPLIVMPGNIVIRECNNRVEIRLPNGNEVSAALHRP